MAPRTALVVGGMIMLLVGGLAGYLYGVDSTPSITTTVLSTTTATLTISASATPYDQLAESFANHMFFLSERNATAIASQYAQNATVVWTGKSEGFDGLYNRTTIPLLMQKSFIGRGGSFGIGGVTRSMVNVSAASATVDSTFDIFGQDYNFFPPGGFATTFNGTISAQDSYVYSIANDAWLISNETWNFTTFNIQT